MVNINLTQEEIDKLAQSLSAKAKAETVKKLGYYYNDTSLTDYEKEIAENIFRMMVKDVELQVRAVLAESLKKSEKIPQDIIQRIVSDSDIVALPFIRDAASLTHGDLVDILKSQSIDRQKAVANRENVPSELSHYIAEKCGEEVIETLLENENAKIHIKTYGVIIDKYSKSDKIKEKMLEREHLPVSIIERIVNSLSEVLQERLLASHNLSDNLVSDIVENIKYKLTLNISQEYNTDAEIKALVKQLYDFDRLSSTLVVRSLCMGDLNFFEYSLFFLTKRTLQNIRKTLGKTKDEVDIRNLLRDANIPNKFFPVIIATLKIIYELNMSLKAENRENFTQKVIERVLTFDSINETMDIKDIEYLISKIS